MAVALMGQVINKLRFLSDFKANIMQEKDQKSFFDLYSGSKEIGEVWNRACYSEKGVMHCVIALTTSKVTRVVSHCKLTQIINR